MIDLTERYETIKSVCENLKLQTKPALRIKTKHQIITSRKPKHARFQNGVSTVFLLMLKS